MSNTLPQLNVEFFEPQIIWFVAIFCVFYVIVKKVIAPYFFSEIESRDGFIYTTNVDIKKMQQKSEYMVSDYQKKFKETQQEAEKMIVATRTQIAQKIQHVRYELNKNTQKQLEEVSSTTKSKLPDLQQELNQHLLPLVQNLTIKMNLQATDAEIAQVLNANLKG